MLRILAALLFLSASALAQIIGTTSPLAGQTATASVTLVPSPLWTVTITCNQVQPFQPIASGTKGTAWGCTVTSNIVTPAPPTPGVVTFTVKATPAWQITPAGSAPCAVNADCVVSFGPATTTAAFALLGQ